MRPAVSITNITTIILWMLIVISPCSRADESARLRKEALATMENIVPCASATPTLAKITFGNNHAIWGRIFADQQIAALVAVDVAVHRDDEWPEDATLFLLLWQNGWRFRQLVGKVSGATSSIDLPRFHKLKWDWDVKHRLSPESYYVLSRCELYPAGDHLSWFCDPKSHTLVPTGWRKDAIPSLSGTTITFRHQDKPGYTPDIYEIFEFKDHPGNLIASFDDNNINGHPTGNGFLIRDVRSGKMISWWFWKKKSVDWKQPEQYAVSRRKPEDDGANSTQDAVVTFDWCGVENYRSENDYFVWRLTGLEKDALWGIWDDGEKPKMPVPQSAKVIGSPEAVEKFTWPPLPVKK